MANVEAFIKATLRRFRRSLKTKFDLKYSNTVRYESPELVDLTKKFFIDVYEVQAEDYMRNEDIMFKLVHNTKQGKKQMEGI